MVPKRALSEEEKQERLSKVAPSDLEESVRLHHRWTPTLDALLVQWINEYVSGKGTSYWDTMQPYEVRPSKTDYKYKYRALGDVPVRSLYLRAALVLHFNRRLSEVLAMLDIGSTSSLGPKLRSLDYLILLDLKRGVLDAALDLTEGDGGKRLTVTLDNFEATASRDKGLRDVMNCKNIFTQAFDQLHKQDPKVLRTCFEHDRVFQVTFKGEAGEDAGGVYREAMSRIVEDCFSPHFNLFVLCPNGVHNLNVNTGKYVPNPCKRSPRALEYFEFVGQMVGISLRVQLCLPFPLPSIIWKGLIGRTATAEDLEEFDSLVFQSLHAIRTCHRDGISNDREFAAEYGDKLSFVCTGSDGTEKALLPGGKHIEVTFTNRERYCDLVEQFRCHEFDAQVTAMRRGFATIIPIRAVQLFTASELEALVCGTPQIDMDLWESTTTYSNGFKKSDPTIKLFWKVLRSLSAKDKSGWIRFAWGRSRLPPKDRWSQHMKLTRKRAGIDDLPLSHTCFFQVELPPYKEEEAMRRALLTCIHFGVGGILTS